MTWLAADPVIVLPAHRKALEALVRAHSTSQQLASRARMILHATTRPGFEHLAALGGALFKKRRPTLNRTAFVTG
jgi:hypothetical protein